MNRWSVLLDSEHVGYLDQSEYEDIQKQVRTDRGTTVSTLLHPFRLAMTLLSRMLRTTPLIAFWLLFFFLAISDGAATTAITINHIASFLKLSTVLGMLLSAPMILSGPFSRELPEYPRDALFNKLVRQKLCLAGAGDLVIFRVTKGTD